MRPGPATRLRPPVQTPFRLRADFDQDGYDDAAFGDWSVGGSRGVLYLFAGGPDGLATTPEPREGPVGQNGFGRRVVAADVDLDGYPDLAVAAPRTPDDPSSYGGGVIDVYRGGPDGLEPDPWLVVHPSDGSAGFGEAFTLADLDGDGYPDLVVGEEDHLGDRGRFLVFLAGEDGYADPPDLEVLGFRSHALLGGYVASGGDLDGDGYLDLAVVQAADGGADSAVNLYLGGPGGPASTPVASIGRAEGAVHWGSDLALASDLDGDGYDDLVVGDGYGNASGDGLVYVYRGRSSGVWAGGPDAVLGEGTGHLGLGGALASGYDVDHDGYDDVIAGASAILLFRGGPSGVDATPAWTGAAYADALALGDVTGDGVVDIVAGNIGQAMGSSGLWGTDAGAFSTEPDWTSDMPSVWLSDVALHRGGDFDGDGVDDLVLLAGGTYYDEVWIHLFDPTVSTRFPEPVQSVEIEAPSEDGHRVSAGDFNGDGLADLVVVAVGGDLCFVHGTGVGLGTACDAELPRPAASRLTSFAQAVASPGDLDGDGYDDLLVSEPGRSVAGKIHLVYGSASGVSWTGAAVLDAPDGVSHLGGALLVDGDYTGDGGPDLVATIEGGAALVYARSGSGYGASPYATISEADGTALYAAAIATGDFDGDGLADLAVGDPGYDGARGRVSIYRGTGAGLSARVQVLDGGTADGALGATLACPGDLDGDGADDLFVGEVDPDGDGLVRLYLGGASGLAEGPAEVEATLSTRGEVAAPAIGDIDGDGLVDAGFVGYELASVYVGFGELAPPACSVSLTWPADGADLTAAGRFAWAGDCDGYWLELSPHADFPAYDTVYNAQLTGTALTFPAAAWPNVARRFTAGGYARVRGAVGGDVVSSEVVPFSTRGLPSAFPPPAATCEVALLSPADGSTIAAAPTFRWDGACTAARLEFSADPAFPLDGTMVLGAFPDTRVVVTESQWTRVRTVLPAGGWWRVVAGASDGEHVSTEAWAFAP